jgi:hypothetical protein
MVNSTTMTMVEMVMAAAMVMVVEMKDNFLLKGR